MGFKIFKTFYSIFLFCNYKHLREQKWILFAFSESPEFSRTEKTELQKEKEIFKTQPAI